MRIAVITFAASLFLASLAGALPARAQAKDYLTAEEADKIRDADTPADRIKLFISFADDRIKKLQYEFTHLDDVVHRVDRIDGLINSYTGCVDDGADLIDLGVEKQDDIRSAVKEMQARGPEWLAYLKELSAKPGEAQDHKDNLDDAIDATTDAIRSADDASKEVAPPPVRRSPK